MKTVEWIVQPTEANRPLVLYLASRLDLSRKKAKALLDARQVFVNRRRLWIAHHKVQAGDHVEVLMRAHAVPVSRRPVVLFEDEDYLVVSKPSGLVSNGPGSIEERLRGELSLPALRAAHRIDRDTSGCLILAKTPAAFDAVLLLFRNRAVAKTYHVIVAGSLEPPDQTIKTPIGGKEAVTRIRTLDAARDASHLLVRIDTGRTHQIRKHLDEQGHPVIGDRHYGTRGRVTDKSITVGRQMLHADSLEFRHPLNGRRVHARAPLPHDFRRCLKLFNLT